MLFRSIEIASLKAKIVAEEQAREKEEAERKKRLAATQAPLPGDAQAAAVLGEAAPEPAASGAETAAAPVADSGGDAGGDIVSMLENRQSGNTAETPEAGQAPANPA